MTKIFLVGYKSNLGDSHHTNKFQTSPANQVIQVSPKEWSKSAVNIKANKDIKLILAKLHRLSKSCSIIYKSVNWNSQTRSLYEIQYKYTFFYITRIFQKLHVQYIPLLKYSQIPKIKVGTEKLIDTKTYRKCNYHENNTFSFNINHNYWS
jgi:hypothetical protein